MDPKAANDPSTTPLPTSTSPTPPPPPPPPLPTHPLPKTPQPPISLKVRSTPPAFLTRPSPAISSNSSTPPGLYFFYGTLRSPSLLSEILSLPSTYPHPVLPAAYIKGYKALLWGQYPAVIKGKEEDVVYGDVFEVEDERTARRLAEYETSAYCAGECEVVVMEGEEGGRKEVKRKGYVFEFCGDEGELREGEWELEKWLKLVRRKG